MTLSTPYKEFSLQSVKFIPNQNSKFLYIQTGKEPDTLTLITTIPELSQIHSCEGFFFLNDTITFLYSSTVETVSITKVTNLSRLLRKGFYVDGNHYNALKTVPIKKPLIYLEEYLEGYRLTYSESIIPHSDALNFIKINH